MSAAPVELDDANGQRASACWHCAGMLHGPVAFCPFCGAPDAPAQRTAWRSAPPEAAVLLDALPPAAPLAPAEDAAPRPAAASATEPRADPLRSTRRSLRLLSAAVLLLALGVGYLAFFDHPPATGRADAAPGQLATAQEALDGGDLGSAERLLAGLEAAFPDDAAVQRLRAQLAQRQRAASTSPASPPPPGDTAPRPEPAASTADPSPPSAPPEPPPSAVVPTTETAAPAPAAPAAATAPDTPAGTSACNAALAALSLCPSR